MLAKLVGGLHKPDAQTALPAAEAAAFVAPLPVRSVSGIGWKMEGDLRARGVTTLAEARQMQRSVGANP